MHTGSVALYERLFAGEHWNYFRYDDPFDKPSPLFDQLQWLASAGFSDVDCFWMNAGHALYGGYAGSSSDAERVTYEMALVAAREALALG